MEGTPLTITKILIISVVLLVVVLFLFNFFGGSQLFSSEQINEFIGYSESRIDSELGIASAGLEPAAFLEVFPGILQSDFDRVEGVVGKYTYENGALLYDLDGEKADYSVTQTISKQGMGTLLHNIALRENIERTDPGLVRKVINAIENKNTQSMSENAHGYGGLQGLPVTIEGTVGCLTYIDQRDPHALKCVIGMHASDGKCYGFRNIFGAHNVSFDIGQKVKVSGNLYPPSEQNIYEIDGIIDVARAEVM